jgi:hypothetical protein
VEALRQAQVFAGRVVGIEGASLKLQFPHLSSPVRVYWDDDDLIGFNVGKWKTLMSKVFR